MFNSKQKTLFSVKEKTQTSVTNDFLNAGLKKSAETVSGNGAVKYSTTGNDFVDQFGKMSGYKQPRSFQDVSTDMSTLWAQNPKLTVMFVLFIRTITRVVSLLTGFKTSSVQRGAGLKHEGIMRMIWLQIFHEDVFYKNVHLFISVGSWKDIFVMLSYDLQYNGWEGRKLNWTKMGEIILAGLENEKTSSLVKKYLPQIKANNKCTTLEAQADNVIAKWICSLVFGKKASNDTYKRYRKLKTTGTAHEWQKLISKGKHLAIDFNTIHGRALSLLVSSKFIDNQGLTSKYEKWIESQPVAKFTGYVHELFGKYFNDGWGIKSNAKKYQIDTVNKQFANLVETAKKGAKTTTSLIVVRDTSSSMTSTALGTNTSSYNVGKSLALFFSEMLPEGPFANAWIEFADTATIRQWKGSTPFEKFQNDKSEAYGSTNFQGVIDLFINLKNQGVNESQFPSGILCISDGEFNRSGGKSNFVTAIEKLKNAGFSKNYVDNFKIILWDIPNMFYSSRSPETKFETYGDVKNVFYLSGYDGSIISFITGSDKPEEKTPTTADELFKAAMDQEVLNMVEV